MATGLLRAASRRTGLVVLAVAALVALGVAAGSGWIGMSGEVPSPQRSPLPQPGPPKTDERDDAEGVNGRRAYDYLKRICKLGPRPSGSGT